MTVKRIIVVEFLPEKRIKMKNLQFVKFKIDFRDKAMGWRSWVIARRSKLRIDI